MKLSKVLKKNGINNEKYYKCNFKKIIDTIINDIIKEDIIDCNLIINRTSKLLNIKTESNKTVVVKIIDADNERDIINSITNDVIVITIENDRLDSCTIYKESESYDERIRIINLTNETKAEININTIYKDRNCLDLVRLTGYGTYNYDNEKCELYFRSNNKDFNEKVKDNKISDHTLMKTIKMFEKFNEELKRKKVMKRY